MDERKFQYKRWGDLCSAPPCSIQAKVLGPQPGNMCQPTLGGPVNNGLSQEQVVVTWNSERRLCISGCVCVSVCACVCTCMCVCVWQRDRGRETDRSICHLERRDNPRWGGKLECAVSISSLTGLSPGSKRFLVETLWFLAMPLVMAHTNFESVKWAIARCAAPPPLKWIDPKWDQQAKSSLFIERLPQTD